MKYNDYFWCLDSNLLDNLDIDLSNSETEEITSSSDVIKYTIDAKTKIKN